MKFILVAVGVLLGLMGALKFSIYCMPCGPVVILLGVVGLALTSTYVERFDDHRKRARAFRAQIDQMLTPPGQAELILDQHPIAKEARVPTFWTKIYCGVIVLGIVCLLCNLIALWGRMSADTSTTTKVQTIIKQLSQ